MFRRLARSSITQTLINFLTSGSLTSVTSHRRGVELTVGLISARRGYFLPTTGGMSNERTTYSYWLGHDRTDRPPLWPSVRRVAIRVRVCAPTAGPYTRCKNASIRRLRPTALPVTLPIAAVQGLRTFSVAKWTASGSGCGIGTSPPASSSSPSPRRRDPSHHDCIDALASRPPGLVDRGSHARKGKSAATQVFGLDPAV